MERMQAFPISALHRGRCKHGRNRGADRASALLDRHRGGGWALARLILPGKQTMLISQTMILGIIGALIGGYVAQYLPNSDQPWMPLVSATVVAFALLVVFEMLGVFKKPVTPEDQKYLDAAAAYKEFRDSRLCDANGAMRAVAETSYRSSETIYNSGKSAQALEELQKAAYALGMKEAAPNVYGKYWRLPIIDSKYPEASAAVIDFRDSRLCTANGAMRAVAETSYRSSETIYKSGKPVQAMEELQKAADALGMKEAAPNVYGKYWKLPVIDSKYPEASAAVIDFRDSRLCNANGAMRAVAETSHRSAETIYNSGKPVQAMEELQKAADALGMKEAVPNVYGKYWKLPVIDSKYPEASAAVIDFRDSRLRTANGAMRAVAETSYRSAETIYNSGKPVQAMEELQKAADALGMKEAAPNVYGKYWKLPVIDSKYPEASAAVIDFRDSRLCTANGAMRAVAETSYRSAETIYSSGKPVQAMEELQKVADALGMKEAAPNVYGKYWKVAPVGPLEQRYLDASAAVKEFRDSKWCAADANSKAARKCLPSQRRARVSGRSSGGRQPRKSTRRRMPWA